MHDDLRDKIPATEWKLFEAIGRYADEPQRLAEIARHDEMRQLAPQLREWLIQAGGWLRLGVGGRDDATCDRLTLEDWTDEDLVAGVGATYCILNKVADAADTQLGVALLVHLTDTICRRLLKGK